MYDTGIQGNSTNTDSSVSTNFVDAAGRTSPRFVHAIVTNRKEATVDPRGLTSIKLGVRNVEAVAGSYEEFGLTPMRLTSSGLSASMPVWQSRSRAGYGSSTAATTGKVGLP